MKKVILYTIITILLIPSISRAEDKYTLLEPLPCIPGTGNDCVASSTIEKMSVDGYIGYIFKFGIAISAFLAIIMIIWGGFEVMLSEAISSKLEGKARVYNAVFGLIMVLSSYLILRTIDPRLVEINTNIKPVNQSSGNWMDAQAELSANLNKLSQEGRSTNIELQQEAAALAKEKGELQGKYDRKEITKAEFDAASGIINEKIKTNKTEKNLGLSKAAGISQFTSAINLINDVTTDENYSDNIEQYTTEGDENSFYLMYSTSIQNARLRSSPSEIVTLEKQRDFFIDQVREERAIKTALGNNNSTQIQSTLNSLQGEFITPTKNAGTGIDNDTYKSIVKARIDKINSWKK